MSIKILSFVNYLPDLDMEQLFYCAKEGEGGKVAHIDTSDCQDEVEGRSVVVWYEGELEASPDEIKAAFLKRWRED